MDTGPLLLFVKSQRNNRTKPANLLSLQKNPKERFIQEKEEDDFIKKKDLMERCGKFMCDLYPVGFPIKKIYIYIYIYIYILK